MTRTKTELQRLIQAAVGELKADLIITGSKVVNVDSGELLDGWEIVVIDGHVCYGI